MTKTAQYHYFAVVYSYANQLHPTRSIIGSIYAPSLKQAKAYLESHHPGATAILAKSASHTERSSTYPVLLGLPPANSRGAGRKPEQGRCLSITLSKVPDNVFNFLEAKARTGDRSAFLVGLVEEYLSTF